MRELYHAGRARPVGVTVPDRRSFRAGGIQGDVLVAIGSGSFAGFISINLNAISDFHGRRGGQIEFGQTKRSEVYSVHENSLSGAGSSIS